ncbi:MAG: NAD-dependent epimerase/dehydratase family protein [Roseburia sp.]|nr:NAD-dependent epimerase/dehydratase family protein [Roseburia sp.]MCM1279609.1 NAD-dependent epimerase/dehydratase family protein [Robinsoniella sp.]
MKILAIGGTYFLGRVFTIVASKENHELFLINRGTYTMDMPSVTEYHLDRHDIAALKKLPPQEYDAVVDFCAYLPKDVENLLKNIPGGVKQYIYISTCDVYKRNVNGLKNESTELMDVCFPGEAGEYMYNKMLLEKETQNVCKSLGIAYTSIRPGIIYGPFNYAPRESMFIQWIIKGQPLPYPIDAEGQFQFVYVKDVARAILTVIGNEKAYNQAFNVCGDEILNYSRFFEVLKKISDRDFTVQGITVKEAIEQNSPLPFPIIKEETELYDGSRLVKELGFEYTDFEKGMEKTFQAFKNVFS